MIKNKQFQERIRNVRRATGTASKAWESLQMAASTSATFADVYRAVEELKEACFELMDLFTEEVNNTVIPKIPENGSALIPENVKPDTGTSRDSEVISTGCRVKVSSRDFFNGMTGTIVPREEGWPGIWDFYVKMDAIVSSRNSRNVYGFRKAEVAKIV